MEAEHTQKPVLIFCHMGLSSFVQSDIRMLEAHFRIVPFHYRRSHSVWGKLRMAASAMLHACVNMPVATGMYSYFAGYHCYFHTLIAFFFRKKIVITAGGFDTASIPSLEYGVFYRKNLLQACVRCVFSLADAIAVVDSTLLRFVNVYADPAKQGFPTGILTFCPGLESKLCVVSGSAESTFWTPPAVSLQREGVLFVARIDTVSTWLAKGGEMVLAMATARQDIKFTLIGLNTTAKEFVDKRNLPNVRVLPFQPAETLRDAYRSHAVFILPSFTEGLPNVLLEAMLCGCIPVVSRVNGMPEAVGNVGYVVDFPDAERWLEALDLSLKDEPLQRVNARHRIEMRYATEQRMQRLLGLLNISGHGR